MNRANQFIFSTGLNDGASILCKKNMKYGLAQIHLIQNKYGFSPKACFISSPDETISRNKSRWNSGIGYGGKINWGNGRDKLIFLNTKPNYCGILVGGLQEKPYALDLIKKIEEIKSNPLYCNFIGQEIKITWDYDVSNHFINCFQVQNLSDREFPPYIIFIHGSVPEFQNEDYGIGLYIDKSKALQDIAIKESTIFETFQYILLDSDADEYYKFCEKAFEFSKIKRQKIAEFLFGSLISVISNHSHQFLDDYNTIYLGSHCTNLKSNHVNNDCFPIALRADISCYLFKGLENFSSMIIKNLNFEKKANHLELLDKLIGANVLPHGGGYEFPDIKNVNKVIEYKDQRFFVCSLKSKVNRMKIIRDVSNLQFKYRGRAVVLKSIQLELGEIIARLNPVFSLKV